MTARTGRDTGRRAPGEHAQLASQCLDGARSAWAPQRLTTRRPERALRKGIYRDSIGGAESGLRGKDFVSVAFDERGAACMLTDAGVFSRKRDAERFELVHARKQPLPSGRPRPGRAKVRLRYVAGKLPFAGTPRQDFRAQ